MDSFAAHIISAMERNGIQRLIFITTMGIYQEIPAWLVIRLNLSLQSDFKIVSAGS